MKKQRVVVGLPGGHFGLDLRCQWLEDGIGDTSRITFYLGSESEESLVDFLLEQLGKKRLGQVLYQLIRAFLNYRQLLTRYQSLLKQYQLLQGDLQREQLAWRVAELKAEPVRAVSDDIAPERELPPGESVPGTEHWPRS